MKSNLALVITLVWAASVSAITIETVPVGDVGNPNDSATGYGGVSYAYNIGKYEVTVGQYTAFLNAVAATDPYHLYNPPSMTSDLNSAGILRTGDSGSYTYSVIGSPNHPVTYVSWADAARFANWMHNGQPTGAEGPGTTETGAYTLDGTLDQSAGFIPRNPDAIWCIPTENEWYKAAYYQPAAAGGDADGYWAYPMKTNSMPYSDQPPGATPNNTRVGNFFWNDGLPTTYNDGFAVTGITTHNPSQNYLTDVGAYSLSPSYYGTFDQGGNVWEFNEARYDGVRGRRGASWGEGYAYLQASTRFNFGSSEFSFLGFRMVSIPIPEPSTLLLAVTAFATLLIHRRKSVAHNRV